jgi:predicted phage terminase large subunit-like protein
MITSRLDHPAKGVIMVVMQRVHIDDLSGVLLRQGGWEHAILPLIAEVDEDTRVGTFHWTRRQGELLVPERYPPEELERLRKEQGPAKFATQYQQQPSEAVGELIKPEHLRLVDLAHLPAAARLRTLSIDTASKQGEDTSYTAGLVMASDGRFHYVIDAVRGKFEFVTMRDAVLRSIKQHRIGKILIEDASVGPALASALKEAGQSVELMSTRGRSKIERLEAHLDKFVDGLICVAKDQPWTPAFVNEVLQFPHGQHDDQVDALTQYLEWLGTKKGPHTPITLGANSWEDRLARKMENSPFVSRKYPIRDPKGGRRLVGPW